MDQPTREQLAATNAQLGTEEPRPGYVIHRHALDAIRRERRAADHLREPWYRQKPRTIALADLAPDVLAALALEIDPATVVRLALKDMSCSS